MAPGGVPLTFDVAVVGAPFLDLTFAGLPRLPGPGEEVVATDLHAAPGGTGMQAVAAARLGLRTALVSPVSADAAASMLREMFEAEGVAWLGPAAARTPVTAVLPGRDEAAMATFQPPDEVTPADVALVRADAVVLSLGRFGLRPRDAATYVCSGPGEIGRFGPSDLPSFGSARALIVNEREARSLTGAPDAASAARALGQHVPAAVVTRGGDGAVGVEAGALVEAPAPNVAVVDPTGAGDLFVAAYVWADRAGLGPEARLRWATLYASLSTTAPTAFAGALGLDELLVEAERRGLGPA